jgi:hypothetical protein
VERAMQMDFDELLNELKAQIEEKDAESAELREKAQRIQKNVSLLIIHRLGDMNKAFKALEDRVAALEAK